MAPGAPILKYEDAKAPVPASPSASIILISPTNRILLLHRVQTSSSFPSAHVFPGGNLDPPDGKLPNSPTDPLRHRDNLTYRTGAIRELFEESGILLAHTSSTNPSLLSIKSHDRQRGMRAVHSGKVKFQTWLKHQSHGEGVLDTQGLIPFTRWITPPNVPKRFTTQMYVYFIPESEEGNESIIPTEDKVETMAPEWRTAREWVEMAGRGEVILFPPQYLLLYLISQHLDGQEGSIREKRERLERFINEDSDPVWRDKVISPLGLSFGRKDGRAVLSLEKPGPELVGSGLKGEKERVVLVRFKKEGPREVEVRWRKDVMDEQRRENGEGEVKEGEGIRMNQDGPESEQDWVRKGNKKNAKL